MNPDRKLIRFGSLSWNHEEWDKKITWGDPDLIKYRGSKIDEQGRTYDAIQDYHVMFALVSKVTPAQMTIIPLERELESKQLTMNKGGMILIGNGFIYYDTTFGDIQS